MAQLCTSYLTFPCFDAQLDESNVRELVQRGDFAFLEYAAFNWIHHVKSVLDTSTLRDSMTRLHQHNLQQFSALSSDSSFQESAIHGQDLTASIGNYWQVVYDSVDSISSGGNDRGKIPVLSLPKSHKMTSCRIHTLYFSPSTPG